MLPCCHAQDRNQTLPVTASLTGLSAQDHLGIRSRLHHLLTEEDKMCHHGVKDLAFGV